MGTPLSGTDGRMQINGVNLNVEEWDGEETVHDEDTTSFEDGGYETGVTSTRVFDFSGKGYWDAAVNPHSNPPNLIAGQTLTNCRMYVSKASNLFANVPSARCLRIKITNKVKGRVDFEFSAKSQGSFTLPGGAAG